MLVIFQVTLRTSIHLRPEENFGIVPCYVGAGADSNAHDETNHAEDGGPMERQLGLVTFIVAEARDIREADSKDCNYPHFSFLCHV